MYPVVTVQGGSHMSFMSGSPPSAVLKSDLNPEISESDAHKFCAQQMATFIGHILGSKSVVSDKVFHKYIDRYESNINHELPIELTSRA